MESNYLLRIAMTTIQTQRMDAITVLFLMGIIVIIQILAEAAVMFASCTVLPVTPLRIVSRAKLLICSKI